MENKENKKPFYKRPLPIISILVIALISGFFYHAVNALPFEARMLLRHLNEQTRTDDMINNPEKYQNLPCLEVQAGKDKYCFDRNRVSGASIYTKPQSDEFQTLKFQFISKLLPKPKDKKEYTLGGIYVESFSEFGYSNLHTTAYYRLKHFSKKNNEPYEIIVKKHNNKILEVGKWVNQTDTAYVYIKDNIPVAYIVAEYNTAAWKHSIRIREYRKSKDEYPIYFNYWTRIETTREQAIKKAVDIAEEIYQFLQKSQINQTPKQEK